MSKANHFNLLQQRIKSKKALIKIPRKVFHPLLFSCDDTLAELPKCGLLMFIPRLRPHDTLVELLMYPLPRCIPRQCQ